MFHIINIALYTIVGVGFTIALIFVISVIVRVRRGKLKFVPADPRTIDPFEIHNEMEHFRKSAINPETGNPYYGPSGF